MFAYDLVGFQTADCVEAFADYVTAARRAAAARAIACSAFGRSTLRRAVPDRHRCADNSCELLRSPAAERAWDRHGARTARSAR